MASASWDVIRSGALPWTPLGKSHPQTPSNFSSATKKNPSYAFVMNVSHYENYCQASTQLRGLLPRFHASKKQIENLQEQRKLVESQMGFTSEIKDSVKVTVLRLLNFWNGKLMIYEFVAC